IPFAPCVVVRSGVHQTPLTTIGHQSQRLCGTAQPFHDTAEQLTRPSYSEPTRELARTAILRYKHRQGLTTGALPQSARLDLDPCEAGDHPASVDGLCLLPFVCGQTCQFLQYVI